MDPYSFSELENNAFTMCQDSFLFTARPSRELSISRFPSPVLCLVSALGWRWSLLLPTCRKMLPPRSPRPIRLRRWLHISRASRLFQSPSRCFVRPTGRSAMRPTVLGRNPGGTGGTRPVAVRSTTLIARRAPAGTTSTPIASANYARSKRPRLPGEATREIPIFTRFSIASSREPVAVSTPGTRRTDTIRRGRGGGNGEFLERTFIGRGRPETSDSPAERSPIILSAPRRSGHFRSAAALFPRFRASTVSLSAIVAIRNRVFAVADKTANTETHELNAFRRRFRILTVFSAVSLGFGKERRTGALPVSLFLR